MRRVRKPVRTLGSPWLPQRLCRRLLLVRREAKWDDPASGTLDARAAPISRATAPTAQPGGQSWLCMESTSVWRPTRNRLSRASASANSAGAMGALRFDMSYPRFCTP